MRSEKKNNDEKGLIAVDAVHDLHCSSLAGVALLADKWGKYGPTARPDYPKCRAKEK